MGARFSGIAHVADIYVTFAAAARISAADLASASAQGPAPLDGVSLWAVLNDPTTPSPRIEVLLYGQGWSADPKPLPRDDDDNHDHDGNDDGNTLGSQVEAIWMSKQLNCSAVGAQRGVAFHQPESEMNFPAANASVTAANDCAAKCCARSNCTSWMLTVPEHIRPPCTAHRPCCWLVNGGKLGTSVDPHAFAGSVGRKPAPPMQSVKGALRSSNFKIIIGSNNYAGWYQAPEDDHDSALALARRLCKLSPNATFPPDDAPNCESPGCLFDLDTGEWCGCPSGCSRHASQPFEVDALLPQILVRRAIWLPRCRRSLPS